MQAVIIAGGKGTRLRERLGDVPKPLAPVGGKPLLEHQISLAKKHGVEKVLLLTGHGAEHIEKYFGDGSRWGVALQYQRETRPLGTAGAVLEAFEELDETFFVLYGDTMLNVDLGRMLGAHRSGTAATLFLHPNNHPQDSDLAELDELGIVRKFHPYPHTAGEFFANLVNAALYVMEKKALARWHSKRDALRYPLDFAKDLFPEMLRQGAVIQGYKSREYIKDAGTPARLDQVEGDYLRGRIQRGSLESAVPAVFFDRDGTLNYDRGWLNTASGMELLPGAADAVRSVNESGRLAVIITNQPVIARGECSEQDLHAIHNKLEWLLGDAHAYLNMIYYCPHHPDAGFAGERVELKRTCTCRKPATGLFELAQRELNIDLSQSWMIGDRAGDVQAAMSHGMGSILVNRNAEPVLTGEECEPAFRCNSVLEATKFLLSERGSRA